MKGQAFPSAAIVAIVCCASALCASAGSAKAYQFIQTDRNVALFHNVIEEACVGLRVVFTGEVAPIQALGIGATFELSSNESGVLVYEGAIAPLGTFEIDWALDGPRIDAAYWIDTNGVEHEIDVHSPYARMLYRVPWGTDQWDVDCVSNVPLDIDFSGRWSKDPDGLPLVRYRWSWSDGVAIEGKAVERTFRLPGWYTVILTVWDAEGLSHSISESFYVYRYRCATV